MWAHSTPADVGKRGELAVNAILAAQKTGEQGNLNQGARPTSFTEMVAHWLKQMGLVHEFRLEETAQGSNRWQVKVRTHRSGSEVLLTDAGLGVSQALPIVALLYFVPERSTVILEKPESHLHPLAQAQLADLIISVVKHRDVQIILESQSESLLLRLQRRIAEEEISREDTRLYRCEASGGFTTVEELELDQFGNIGNWPDGFMGDAFVETAKAELTRMRRCQQIVS